MEKYCISIDWLSVYCIAKVQNWNTTEKYELKNSHYSFTLKELSMSTSVFNNAYEIIHCGSNMKCAIMQYNPRTPAIDKRAVVIKLENRMLYHAGYIEMLYAIIEAMGVNYKGITRIDFAYDCNKYVNGRSPYRFIHQYLTMEIEENGYIYLNGIKQFSAYGTKSRSSSSKVTSISFGSASSRIRSYIYDKSKELREVKDKPWIREYWQENGLIDDEKTHVWRSEISIKAEGTDILNMSTGELFRLKPQYFKNQQEIERMFHQYAAKYFDFRIKNGQKNKRHFDKLVLFERRDKITCKPIHISRCADTGRMEKICINKLHTLSETYSDLGEYNRTCIEGAITFLEQLRVYKTLRVEAERSKMALDTFKSYKWLNSEGEVIKYWANEHGKLKQGILECSKLLQDAEIEQYMQNAVSEWDLEAYMDYCRNFCKQE